MEFLFYSRYTILVQIFDAPYPLTVLVSQFYYLLICLKTAELNVKQCRLRSDKSFFPLQNVSKIFQVYQFTLR